MCWCGDVPQYNNLRVSKTSLEYIIQKHVTIVHIMSINRSEVYTITEKPLQ